MSPRTYAAALIAIAAMFTSACGGAASIATAPTSIAGTSGTAVITGQVSGVTASTPATSTQQSLNATAAVTVTVVGTGISTSVDGAGRFTLAGVPSGDVQLKIEGRGASAVVTIAGVSDADQIEITVSVNGSAARVESEHRGRRGDNADGNDAGDSELQGAIAGLTGSCPVVTFTIGTTTVRTSPTTRFADASCARFANGQRVEVKGTRQADGSIAATKLEALRD